jgi:pimeloyl-ACP methyl ester carboxylesterase
MGTRPGFSATDLPSSDSREAAPNALGFDDGYRRTMVQQIWVTTSAGDIAVSTYGDDGVSLLLLHGALSDGSFWDATVRCLVPLGYRCVVPTLPLGSHERPLLPGADRSPSGLASLVAELVATLGLRRVIVVGTDSGGALTQLLMGRHPGTVDRAVLAGCDAYEYFLPPVFRYLRLLARIPGGMRVVGLTMRSRLMRRMPLAFGWLTRSGVTNEQAKRWSHPLLTSAGVRGDLAAALIGMRPKVLLDNVDGLRAFPRPVLLAWGDYDRAFPRRLAERLGRDLPDARLVTIPGSAAFSALDAPETLATEIDTFLRSAPHGPGGLR